MHADSRKDVHVKNLQNYRHTQSALMHTEVELKFGSNASQDLNIM